MDHFLDYERSRSQEMIHLTWLDAIPGVPIQKTKRTLLSWTWNDLRISYLGEYIGGLTSPVSFLGDYEQDIDSQMYHDIVAEYNFGKTGTTIQAGITNFTDEAPPYIDLGFNGSTDPSTYRMFGQGYYIQIRQSF